MRTVGSLPATTSVRRSSAGVGLRAERQPGPRQRLVPRDEQRSGGRPELRGHGGGQAVELDHSAAVGGLLGQPQRQREMMLTQLIAQRWLGGVQVSVALGEQGLDPGAPLGGLVSSQRSRSV
jgi:hypothetical protein